MHGNKYQKVYRPYTTSIWDMTVGKRRSNPITGLDRPLGLQEIEVPRISIPWHMKVARLLALHSSCLYLPGDTLVLISARGWVEPRAIVRDGKLSYLKIPVISLRIKLATLWLASTNCATIYSSWLWVSFSRYKFIVLNHNHHNHLFSIPEIHQSGYRTCHLYKIINSKKYLEANTEELWLLLGLGESRFCGMNCLSMAEKVPLIKQLPPLTMNMLNNKWFVFFFF